MVWPKPTASGADMAFEHYRLAAARSPDSVPVTLELAKSLPGMGERLEAARSDVFLGRPPNTKTPKLFSGHHPR